MRPFAAILSLLAIPSLALGALLPRTPLLDVCAHIELNLLVELGLVTDLLDLLHLNLPIGVTGEVNVCLCLSALPLFLTANADAAAAVSLAGSDVVEAFLAAVINTIAGGRKCQYPTHSTSVCTAASPCGYQCDSGYHRVGSACVPNTPSGGVRRSLSAPSCSRAGERVCGTPNGKSQWECVNVLSELESCGGCSYPPPFPALAEVTPLGTDCTAIPHVSDVRCAAGACQVQRCGMGYVPSADRTACVPFSHNKSGIKGGHHVVGDILGQFVSLVVGK